MSSLYILLLALIFSIGSAAALYSSDYSRFVLFHWKGDLHSHSITFKIFASTENLQNTNLNAYLILYTKPEDQTPSNFQIYPIQFTDEPYPVSKITVDSLTPKTHYFYTFIFTTETNIAETDFLPYYSASKPQEFRFQTPDIALKHYSFTFGASSCAVTGSTSSVFTNLTNENLNFFIHMGDLHYSDIATDDVNLFYEAYYKVFNSQVQRDFFQSTPIIYNWDDHDFGPNDAIGTSPSKSAVTEAYRKFVPHHPLKNYLPTDDSAVFPDDAPQAQAEPATYLDYDSESEFGIFRSFIVGRCLFIVMDLRSFQDVIPGDIMGQEQKNWIENQLRFAGNNPDIKMVFIISSIPWIDIDRGALWEDFSIDQEWIGQLVEQHINRKEKKLMMLAGDAHMTAFDDGRNNKHGGFPVVQAASLDQRPSCKGGPYSHGYSIERGQYAVIQVTDDPDREDLCVKVDLKRLGDKVISYDTCNPGLYPVSETQHCPPAVWVYLMHNEKVRYFIVGGVVLVLLCAFGACWLRKKKQVGGRKNSEEGYGLVNEENEMEDFRKASKNDEKKQGGNYVGQLEESVMPRS